MNIKNTIDENSSYDYLMDIAEVIIQYKNSNDEVFENILKVYYKNEYLKYWDNFKSKLENISNFSRIDNADFLIDTSSDIKINIDNGPIGNRNLDDFIQENKKHKNADKVNVTAFALNLDINFYDYLCSFIKNKKLIDYILQLHYDYDENSIRKATALSIKSRINYINQNIEFYENKINKFEKKFDNNKIYYLFKQLAKLDCLILIDDSNFECEKIYIKNNLENIYIFFNESGKIAYNTWLYSFFNNIFLINYDVDIKIYKKDLCLYSTINNEIYKIIKLISKDNYNDYNISLLKKLYYKILNSNFTSVKEKEFLILFLWINIHENLLKSNSFILYTESTLNIIKHYIYFFINDSNRKYFIKEIENFYDFIDINNMDNMFEIEYPKYFNKYSNNFDRKFLGYIYYAIYIIKNYNE